MVCCKGFISYPDLLKYIFTVDRLWPVRSKKKRGLYNEIKTILKIGKFN